MLKRIAENYLPHDLIHRRKVGLTIPVSAWLADPAGLGRYLDTIEAPDSELSGYGDQRGIRALVTSFRRAPDKENSAVLLSLINAELWLRSLRAPLPA